MELEYRRADLPVDTAAIDREIGREARDVYGWSNGPGDRYDEHEHAYAKLLYCTSGSIDFILSDRRVVSLHPGDRLVLPPRTRHSAVVGPDGCSCIEGKLLAP